MKEEHCKNEAKVTGIHYNKETFFFPSMIFWENYYCLSDFKPSLLQKPLNLSDALSDRGQRLTQSSGISRYFEGIFKICSHPLKKNAPKCSKDM